MDDRWKRPYRLWKWLAGISGNIRYTSISAGLEFRAILDTLCKGCKLIHFLYGDYDYCYASRLYGIKRRNVTVTLHNPPGEMRRRILKKKYFSTISGIIALGTNQLEYCREVAPHAAHRLIPHGVDVEFFCPNDESEGHGNGYGLIVGAHLRNWEATIQFVRRMRSAVPGFEFRAVLPPGVVPQVLLEEVVNAHRVTDEALRELYRHAAFLLYMPTDCVASNAVLEAISCGTPVLALKKGAAEEYLSPECAAIEEERHLSDLVDTGICLARYEDLRRKMGAAARERALRFDWRIIAKEISRFLAQFC